MAIKNPALLFFLLGGPAFAGPLKQGPAPVYLNQSYSWREGGKSRTVWLDPSYVMEYGAAKSSETGRGVKSAAPGSMLVKKQGAATVWKLGSGKKSLTSLTTMQKAQPTGSFSPIFRESRKALSPMKGLPGGVIITFKPDWNEEKIIAWAKERGLDLEEKIPAGTNMYKIKTQPGLPSLTKANEIAATGETLGAEPNWWLDNVAK
jgi:hypothetical protein